jgi:hypothetical protein
MTGNTARSLVRRGYVFLTEIFSFVIRNYDLAPRRRAPQPLSLGTP